MNMQSIKSLIGKTYQRAIVTGGAGFIGSNLIKELLDTGIDVISIDSYIAGKKQNILPFLQNKHFKDVECDVRDYENLKKAFDGVDIVFHQAASKKNVCLKDPRQDLEVNGGGTFNILEISRDFGVKKVVHASTGSVYGEAQILPQTESHPLNPVSYYGVSKLAGERYAKAFEHLYDLNVSILRYFHVYGPNQEWGTFGGVIPIFIYAVLNGISPTIFGDGTQERSFTYVGDVVNANLFMAVTPETKGEVYNCASGVNITIQQMCEEILRRMHREDLRPQYGDWTIGDIKKFLISNEKLCNLGFEFQTSFEDGLDITIQNYTERYKKGLL